MQLEKEEYTQVYDNESITGVTKEFFFQCCDCSLTHKFKIKVRKDGKLDMRINIDQTETKKARSKGEQK